MTYEEWLKEFKKTWGLTWLRKISIIMDGQKCNPIEDKNDFLHILVNDVVKRTTRKDFDGGAFPFSMIFINWFFSDVDEDDEAYKMMKTELDERIGKRIPDGEIIGYKKAIGTFGLSLEECIIKLRITEDALRSKAFGKKCRCNKAYVEEIYACNGPDVLITEAFSSRDRDFIYRIGEWVSVDNFDTCPWIECSTGIHFFENEEDAKNYVL